MAPASVNAAMSPAIGGFLQTWRLEWRRALRRRRLFVMNAVVPLALVVPIAAGAAPQQHAAVVYAVLFTFFGTFGSAIPLLRDAERGMVRRISLVPLDPGRVLLGRALAGAAIDTVQLAPACAVIVLAGRSGPGVAWLALVLPVTLAFAGMLGTWVAAIARSVAEGALIAAVTALLLLHASGTFRTPAHGTVGDAIEIVAPLRAIHEVVTGGRVGGIGALAVGASVAALVTVLLGRHLMRSLARADGRH
jgi:hypothetical protein